MNLNFVFLTSLTYLILHRTQGAPITSPRRAADIEPGTPTMKPLVQSICTHTFSKVNHPTPLAQHHPQHKEHRSTRIPEPALETLRQSNAKPVPPTLNNEQPCNSPFHAHITLQNKRENPHLAFFALPPVSFAAHRVTHRAHHVLQPKCHDPDSAFHIYTHHYIWSLRFVV